MIKTHKRLYVVAETGYDCYEIVGIYATKKQATKARVRFNRLIRAEWKSHLHLYRNCPIKKRMYKQPPHDSCIIQTFLLNEDRIFMEECLLQKIKYNMTHTMKDDRSIQIDKDVD